MGSLCLIIEWVFRYFIYPLVCSPSPLTFLFFLVLGRAFRIDELFVGGMVHVRGGVKRCLSHGDARIVTVITYVNLVVAVVLTTKSVEARRRGTRVILRSDYLRAG